ncbi:MAG: DNA-processing protein DprA [Coriobacteriales bacterium]|jgi:DNA processing protein|nr:DNA-processing protein DprA [Coriobacteriales bacterium]
MLAAKAQAADARALTGAQATDAHGAADARGVDARALTGAQAVDAHGVDARAAAKSQAPGTEIVGSQEPPRHEIYDTDERYPERLRVLTRPPGCLYVQGKPEVLGMRSLAIVGARKATPYGLSCARHFARIAAARSIVVISGGAIGCDQAAHKAALEVGGLTVVVLGCGADVVYPARAGGLFSQVIDEGGAIVAEAPWGAPPSRWGFRRRNRLIAGIACATLIVEAGLPSGTFSTADATLAQGKEVLAVPGSIFARESKGANRLISQGALPIVDDESFVDALTQIFGNLSDCALPFAPTTASPRSTTADESQSQALVALAQQPLRAEELLGICGDGITEVIRCLTSLELAGLVTRLRDGRYALGQQ